MRRGEVWWAYMGIKQRPIVLVSRDSHIETRSMILAAPVTARIRRMEAEVLLGPADGLPKPCAADASSIDLVAKSRLIRRIASLSSAKLDEFDAALRFSLGLD